MADLPEALVAGREEVWLRHFYSTWCYDPLAITDEEVAVYVRSYRQPGAVRDAMCDYRAGSEDVAQDNEDAGTKIACPTLALWGEEFELVGKMFDLAAIWKGMATDVRAVAIPRYGHLPHEERLEEVNRELLAFLEGWSG